MACLVYLLGAQVLWCRGMFSLMASSIGVLIKNGQRALTYFFETIKDAHTHMTKNRVSTHVDSVHN